MIIYTLYFKYNNKKYKYLTSNLKLVKKLSKKLKGYYVFYDPIAWDEY